MIIKFLTVVIFASTIFVSCTKEESLQGQTEKATQNNDKSKLDLSNLQFDFNLNFDGKDIKIPIEEGYGKFVKELSEYAFSKELANEDKVSFFRIE